MRIFAVLRTRIADYDLEQVESAWDCLQACSAPPPGSSKGWVTLAKAGLNCVRHCVRAGIGFELPLSEGDEEDEDEEDDEAMDEEYEEAMDEEPYC